MTLEPMYWTDTMIEDTTFVPCGPLLEGEDMAARLEKTRQWWAELLDTPLDERLTWPLKVAAPHLMTIEQLRVECWQHRLADYDRPTGWMDG